MNLYQASCWYFDRSQTALKSGLVLSFVLLALTVVTFVPCSSIQDSILIVLIAITQVLQMWLKYRAFYWLGKADEPRRMFQLQSGLGVEPSAEKCLRIEEEVGKCDKPIDPNYWVSRKPQSPVRMVEMLLESSYYTRSLACKCRNLFYGIGAFGLMLSVIALVSAYRMSSAGKSTDLIAHIVITVFVFFLTGDFWIVGFLYDDLRTAADESHKYAFQLLQKREITPDEALEVVMDYNTAVVQAPPLLSSKHLKSKDDLDVLFRRSYGKLLGVN
jgi:hypothetical protein